MADLSRNQSRALTALVSQPTIGDAAKACGLSRRTLRRYMADPAFRRALSEQQDHVLSLTVAGLSALQQKALAAIDGALSPGHDKGPLRIRAADLALKHLKELREQHDLTERVIQLEQRAGGR